MIGYLLLALVGCFLGVITGLTPGLHINTVAILSLSLYPSMGLDSLDFAVVMVAMAVTHTFLDFIPAIFLGVPEEETALSVLPTHKLLLQGKAMEAVKLTALGSLFGLGFALILLAPVLFLIPVIYSSLRGIIVYILILAVFILIIRERSIREIGWSSLIFLLSGILGLLIFRQHLLSTTQVLFPIFVGLFGLSNILYSLRFKTRVVPQEEFARVDIDRKMISSGFLGSLGGLVVGILPAMSPSQVGILIYDLLGTEVRSFIIAVSAINTSDAIYSFVSLYTIQNPRSGVATMVGKVLDLDFETMLLLIGVIAFVGIFATLLHLMIGKWVMKFIERINYRALSIATILLVFLLVYIVTGWFGIFLSLLATSIGILPILAGVSRTHGMGVLLLPTILYFLGLV